MIDPVDLYQTLHRKPFQPFRVFLKDGRIFDIHYERNNVVSADYFVIGIPSKDDPSFVAERTVRVPLELVDRVEDISSAIASVIA
jgi:hypothetical protein